MHWRGPTARWHVTTWIRTTTAALVRALSPLRFVALDLDELELGLTGEDLVPEEERPRLRWPTMFPGYRPMPPDRGADPTEDDAAPAA